MFYEVFLKLFRSKNIEHSPLYVSYSDKAWWNSIAIRGRMCHLYCASKIYSLPQQQMFSSKCSSLRFSFFWEINEMLKEIKSLVKRRFSFCHFIYLFQCKFDSYHPFLFFDWFISCLVKRPHLNQQLQSYLLPQSYSVRFPLDQIFASMLQERLWKNNHVTTFGSFRISLNRSHTPFWNQIATANNSDNWKSHYFSRM